MTTNNTSSLLLALPEDVQRRLLAGCRYEDLFSVASVCRPLRDVVNSPRFTNARLSHGFAERAVVLVGTRRPYAVDIRSAQTRSSTAKSSATERAARAWPWEVYTALTRRRGGCSNREFDRPLTQRVVTRAPY